MATENLEELTAENARLSEELRRCQERFHALMEETTDLLAIFGPDASVKYANEASMEVLGYSADEMLGKVAHDLVVPEDRERAEAVLGGLAGRPGGSTRVELRMRRRDGGIRIFDAVVRNLFHVPSVGGFVVAARDVTDHRRLEAQYLQAQKLESIGRLAGGVAHDFNNMLVGILGYAEFLEASIPAGKPRLEDLREIRRAGERARDLTQQLLAVARRQVIEPRVIDLNEVLRDAERLLRRVLGEDVDLSVSSVRGLWSVRADPTRLQQVLLNLAVNARDAMPRGGKLTIETANATLDEQYAATHEGVAPGQYVLLAVSDSGEGMTPETRAHLFEPFFTTKEAGRGTGLGLATVYGIVKQAGGLVWVYSEPGKGTVFRIYLPRIDAVAAAAEARPAPVPRGGHETVLVVEDDEIVRALLVRAIEEAGYSVLSAAGGRDALAKVDAFSGVLHLLITDVVMPGMGGRELAAAVAERRRGVKVIYVSGYTENAIVHQGVLDPGVHYLPKPFTPSVLQATVRAVLDEP